MNLNNNFLKLLGWYQILGGITGIILFILETGLGNVAASPLILLLFGIGLSFYTFSVYSGYACLKRNQDLAVRMTIINQFLQIFGLFVLGYGYEFVSGVYVTLGIDVSAGLNFHLGTGVSRFGLAFNVDSDDMYFNFNLVAIGILVWIDKQKNKLERELVVESLDS